MNRSADIHFGLWPWEKFFLVPHGIFFSAIPRVATGKKWFACKAVGPNNIDVNLRYRTFMVFDKKTTTIKQLLHCLVTIEMLSNPYWYFVTLHDGIFVQRAFFVYQTISPQPKIMLVDVSAPLHLFILLLRLHPPTF